MPYSTIDKLPKEVQDKYTTNQLHAFIAAFNSAVEAGKEESAAFPIAHAAAENAGKNPKKEEKLLENGSILLVPFPNHPELLNLQVTLPTEVIPVSPDKLHLSLLILPNGELPDFTLYPQQDFMVYLEKIMVFPEGNDGFPIVAKLGLCPELAALQAALYVEALAKYNVSIGDFSPPDFYRPHITLGYSPVVPSIETDHWYNVALPVGRFSLMQGDREIRRYPLHGLPIEQRYKQSIASKLWDILKSVFIPEPDPTPFLFNFKLLKENLWEAWYTNAYQDREHEYIAEKALEEDIQRMNDEDAMPELRFFHLKGTRMGEAIAVAKIGRFAVAVGTFDDTPFAQAMKSVLANPTEDWGLSHGFFYKPSDFKRNVYHKVKTFEISVLPSTRAANGLTLFAVKEGELGKNKDAHIEEARALLKSKLAEAGFSDIDVDELITKGLAASSQADEQLEHKAEGEIAPDLMGRLADAVQKMADGMIALNMKLDSLIEGRSEKPEPEAEPEESPLEKQLKAMSDKLATLEAENKKRAETVQGYHFENILQDLATKNQSQITGTGDEAVDKAFAAIRGMQQGGQ